MPVKVYDGTNWVTVAGDGAAGAPGTNGTNGIDASPFVAGKNAIINGDMNIWQRGTSFTPTAGASTYSTDRFYSNYDGTAGTRTISRQTFTPGTAPVAGYEGQYFWRYNKSVAGTGGTIDYLMVQKIEDCRTFAGQTVTLSFWAKSDASRTISAYLQQDLGSGGSGSPAGQGYSALALTTSWQRFTMTVIMPSLAGMTIGTSSSLVMGIYWANTNLTGIIDIWGVQVEAASTASNFQTATGTKQGELAACQRYYFRNTGGATFSTLGAGFGLSTTQATFIIQSPVQMRVTPTVLEFSTLRVTEFVSTSAAITAMTISAESSPLTARLNADVASGLTKGVPYGITANNSATAYLGLSAEL